MKTIVKNANMMEVTVVIMIWMDGTHTVMNANVKIPMQELLLLQLQIVRMNGNKRSATGRKKMENVTRQKLLGIARRHVNFVNVLICGQHGKTVMSSKCCIESSQIGRPWRS